MADDQTVTPSEPAYEPEPIPENIADTEINGLEPVQPDETAPAEDVTDETTDEPPVAPQEDTEEVEVDETPEDTKPVIQETEAPDAKELARNKYEERQQAKAQRDYVAEERSRIREYEQTTDTSDVEERLKIMEARQYVDTVERNRQSITRDVAQARELPFFKTGSQQSELLFNQAIETFANAYGVTDTDSGEWIAAQDRNGNDVQLLPYLQQQAAIYEQALANVEATATVNAQRSEAKMRAKAINPSNSGKATSSGDDLADLLDKIGNAPLN